jgi:hypothetical protein
MATLVFHIGMHKTGTTALQHACDTNRQLLAQVGIHYPDLGRGPWHHGLTAPWLPVQPAYALPSGPQTVLADLAARHAGTDDIVLLSSEEFSSGRPEMHVDMGALRDMARGFDRVRVICTLRHQVDFIQSIWLEITKKRWVTQWDPFLRSALQKHRAAGLFVDYLDLDRHLLTGFAPEEITYIDYGTAAAGPHGSIGAVLAAAGLASLPEGFAAPPRAQSNVSESPLLAWFPRVLSAPKTPSAEMAAALTAFFLDQFGETPATTLYSHGQRDETIGYFDGLNATFRQVLAERGAVPPDLRAPVPAPGTIFRDDLRPPFWMALARMLVNLHETA